MPNYSRESLAEYARTNGLPVASVLAMSPKNDPFFCGSDAQLKLGQWFAKNWRLHARSGLHLRGIHYAFVGIVMNWDGVPYLNTDHDWNVITEASKYARYLGLVPYSAIPDHKASPPRIHAYFYDHGDPSPDIRSMRERVLSDISFRPYNPHMTQPYMQEVWIEKTSLQDVLDPLCQRYGANLIQGEGQLSVTAVDLLIKRLTEADRPGRVYYICDWDPQGESMPTAVARKIEYFNRVVLDAGLDCKLKWLALTREQTVQYRLPRTPIKAKDLGRAGFEERYGEGATELDALHARHPGVLERMVEHELVQHFDVDAWNRTVHENDRIEAELRRKMRAALRSLRWDYKSKFKVPDPRDADPDDDGDDEDWLYDSDRSYDEQLESYKAKRGDDDDA